MKLQLDSTALVLIDLQHGVAHGFDSKPYPVAEVVERAASVADAFRRRHASVILVRAGHLPGERDRFIPDADELMPPPSRVEGWSEIVPELGPKEGDVVITKRQWGAFYGTELDLILRRTGIRTLVLGGISTNFAVESTARSAMEHGYQQFFLTDAMAARVESDHSFSINRILPRMGKLLTCHQLLAELDP